MLRVVFWSALTLFLTYSVVHTAIDIFARGGLVCTTSTQGGAISDHCSFGTFPGEFLLQNVLWIGWYGLLGILAVLAGTNAVSAIGRFRRIEPYEQGLWVAVFLLAIALIAASKDLVFTDGKVICITTNGIEDCIQRSYSKFVPAAAFLAAITGLVCVGIPLTRHDGGPPAQHAGA